DEHDSAASLPVAIINESAVRRFFPHADPIAQRLKQGWPESKTPWRMIVGVVGDVKRYGLDAAAKPEIYLPHAQAADGFMTLLVRTAAEPMSLSDAVRREVHAVDPLQPVSNVKTMEQLRTNSFASRRLPMVLLGIFAGLALVLAAVGIYGVMSYSVGRRTQEIGIRMALGALRRDVIRLILNRAMWMSAIGLGLGLTAALAVTRVMSSLLFGVAATDMLTFTLVALLLLCVALGASYIPARRALKVDPMVALRHE